MADIFFLNAVLNFLGAADVIVIEKASLFSCLAIDWNFQLFVTWPGNFFCMLRSTNYHEWIMDDTMDKFPWLEW